MFIRMLASLLELFRCLFTLVLLDFKLANLNIRLHLWISYYLSVWCDICLYLGHIRGSLRGAIPSSMAFSFIRLRSRQLEKGTKGKNAFHK